MAIKVLNHCREFVLLSAAKFMLRRHAVRQATRRRNKDVLLRPREKEFEVVKSQFYDREMFWVDPKGNAESQHNEARKQTT